MENKGNIVSAAEVHREFKTIDGTLHVLRGVTFDVARHEMVAVTGASGVGKSTLLHILGGLDQPTGGDVAIDGESLTGKSQHWLARFRNRRIGFVFQQHYLLGDFSALENIMIPKMMSGSSRGEAARVGEKLLDRVGLSERKNHRPTQLSGGEQQRVAVARALANNPDIVLADEPSGNLDTETGRLLHELLFSLNADSHVTFLIATHNRELAGGCHRQFEIVDGKMYESHH